LLIYLLKLSSLILPPPGGGQYHSQHLDCTVVSLNLVWLLN